MFGTSEIETGGNAAAWLPRRAGSPNAAKTIPEGRCRVGKPENNAWADGPKIRFPGA